MYSYNCFLKRGAAINKTYMKIYINIFLALLDCVADSVWDFVQADVLCCLATYCELSLEGKTAPLFLMNFVCS